MNNITKNALEESLKKFLLQKPLEKSNRSNDVNGNDRNHSCRMRKQ